MDKENKKGEERKRNPAEKANPLSRLTLMYMLPQFISNYRKGVTENDLFAPLDEHKSDMLGEKLERIWKEEHKKHETAALHFALIKMFGARFALLGTLKSIDAILVIVAIPLSIGRLVQYFQNGEDRISEEQAYISAAILLGCLFIDIIVIHPVMMGMMHMTMKMRIACSSLLYRKVLRLNRSSLAQTTVGQMVNLLSNDAGKFDHGFVISHFVWVAPVQTIVGTYMLYRFIGIAAVFGVLFLVSFIPLQIYLGKRTSVLRSKIALRTDERVRLMNEIISSIQVIKIFTWEKSFSKLISLARNKETQSIKRLRYVIGSVFSFETFVIRTSIFISIVTYVLLGNALTAETVFLLTSIFNSLNPVVTTLFSLSITSLAEVHVSIKRMQKFMAYSEIESSTNVITNGLARTNKAQSHPRIIFQNATAKWLPDSPESTLKNLNLNIDSSQLVAVVGPVGGGKSSLLNVILKELPTQEGLVIVNGVISYSCQEAWLFNASVRQNILFGNDYDQERYENVVRVCALESDFAILPYGDKTLVGERGKTLSGGQKARINLARCVYKNADIYLLDDPLSAVDANVGKQLYDDCIKGFLKNKICVLNTHQLQYLKNADKIIIMKEGKILTAGNYEELQKSGYDFAKLLEEFSNTEPGEMDAKELKTRQTSEMEDDTESINDAPEIEKETIGKGSIGVGVYKEYFKSGGNGFVIFLLVMSFLLCQGVTTGGAYFVTYWVNLEQDFSTATALNETTETIDRLNLIYWYFGITLATVILAIGHTVFFFIFCLQASTHIHDFVFSKVMAASMRFFNSNPSGRILNRFSKDLGIIDEYIPNVFFDVVDIGLLLIGALILTWVVNPWLIIPSIVFMATFYSFRTIYIETSRSVKRIEGIKRSPIYGQMMTTLHGLATIRACRAEEMLIKEFDTNQDHHSSAWFFFIASTRAFGFWLDVLCVTFTAGLTLGLLTFNRGLHGGDMGLVLTQCMSLLGSLQWGVRQWSELESQMTSVERILEYTQLENEPERPNPEKPLPATWPEFGKIEFRQVSLRYHVSDPDVLKNLNFVIHPKEKIGIVGRTGAGKSSIMAALFQLYEIEGNILVDDVDCTKLPLADVRSKISIIPQEPVLFSASMRKNLDPFDEYADEVLWNSLEQVEMKQTIADLPGGLSVQVSEGGSNYSVGQRQLICLARAIIRNNKILVMDEATANVDHHTDSLIQATIRRKFIDCTVLTIAHRIHTVMDSDRILVMHAGKVEEFDHPNVLLQNKQGLFYHLVQKTGQNASKNFTSIAAENDNLKKSQ